MADQTEPSRSIPVSLAILVVVSAAVLAGLCGIPAAGLYPFGERPDPAQTPALMRVVAYWAPVTGVVVGVLWCVTMSQWVMKGGNRFASRGAFFGVIAGSFSTLLLHIGLAQAVDAGGIGEAFLGLLFGIPGGAALGAFWGGWYGVIINERKRSLSPGDDDA